MMRPFSPLIITWSDLQFVWRKYRRWMMRFGLVSAIAGTLIAFLVPVRHTAKGLFREGNASGGIPSSVLPNLFSSLVGMNSDGGGLIVMQSDRVLNRVIQKLGLQIKSEDEGIFHTLVHNTYANVLFLFGSEPADKKKFTFERVEYCGREPLHFALTFKDKDYFTVHDLQGNFLAEGALVEKITWPQAAFCLIEPPLDIALGKSYRFSLQPWENAAKKILAHLEIRPEKLDKSLLRLYYSHPSRKEAVRVLDGIMTGYMQYLQDEHSRIADQQLAFLENRQAQFLGSFEKELDEYLQCLKQNISMYGFFEVEQQVEALTAQQESLKKKLLDLDNLSARLKMVQAAYVASKEESVAERSEPSVIPVQNIAPLAEKKSRSEQFAGIDLETAQKLHAEYQKEVDHSQEKIDALSFLLSRIHRKDFDLNALGVLIHDSVTENLVRSAGDLALQCKDVANRSQKDLQRIEESLSTQKLFIAEHLRQSLELYKQNALIAQRKLASLRDVMLDLAEAEKVAIYAQLQEIQQQASELPERWKLEKQLTLKGQVMGKMIEGITQINEGKTIEFRLKQLGSKVIDNAHCPLKPKKMPFPLFLACFIGASIGIVYFFFFCRTLLNGFPLSEAAARALQLTTAGSVGPLCDVPLQQLAQRDSETIRALASYLQKKKGPGGVAAALIAKKRPSFINNLARLLIMRGENVKLMELAPEVLHSGQWAQLLTNAREGYDVVLCIYSGELADIDIVLEKTDAQIIAVQEETLEQLERSGLLDRLKQPGAAIIVCEEIQVIS